MKRTFYILSFLSLCGKVLSQDIENYKNLKKPSIIFKDFVGFRERIQRVDNKVKWFYTITGNEYDIHVQHLENSDVIFGKKVISKLFENTIKKNADYFKANIEGFPSPNGVAQKIIRLNDTISITNISYYFPDYKDTGYYRIDMVTYFKRDTLLENEIIHSIFYDGIYDSIFRSSGKNIINFAGRDLQIKAPFVWMGTQNIYCPEMGQMNWSQHKTLYNANRARDIQIIANESSKKTDIIKKDTVDIAFENVKQKALRITYKANLPRIFWGKGSKILIVYYVISLRDDRYITTTLSHYEDQLIDGDVPPPLNSVMSIKN